MSIGTIMIIVAVIMCIDKTNKEPQQQRLFYTNFSSYTRLKPKLNYKARS